MGEVKALEQAGYSFEAAGGSLELLIRRTLGECPRAWTLHEYQCSFRKYKDGHAPVCEASVKLNVGDKMNHTISAGHGVVNALDGALRKALQPFFPDLEKIQLIDYKVRIIDGEEATAAKTRVLIVQTDGETTWGTVGVSDSIIEASWIALTDGLDLFLQKRSD